MSCITFIFLKRMDDRNLSHFYTYKAYQIDKDQSKGKSHKMKFSILHRLSGLLVLITACCTKGVRLNPRVESPGIFKIDFHQQKFSSLLIACDIKLEGALYSVFYAETSASPMHPRMNRVCARLQALSSCHYGCLWQLVISTD